MLAVMSPFAMLAVLLAWRREIQIGAGLLVLGFGAVQLIRRRHPRFLARIPPSRLAFWSFAVAIAHGAGLMLVPIVTPEIVFGVSLFLVFTQLYTNIPSGLTRQLLGHVTFTISFVVVIIRGRLASIGARYRMAIPAGSLRIVGLGLLMGLGLFLITASTALADPVPEAHAPCPLTQEEARRLGDSLYEQGAYQSAGECYQAAGEYGLANRAFVKAVGPQSTATASQLSGQRDRAKIMLRKVELAFRAEH